MKLEAPDAERLYRQLGGPVYRRCLRLLGSERAAAEAAQEALCRVLREAHRKREPRARLRVAEAAALSAALERLAAERRKRPPEARPPRGCPSELELDAHLAGEDRSRAAHLEACPGCAARLEEARRAAAAFEEVAPGQLPGVLARLEAEAALAPKGAWKLLSVLTPVGLALAALGLLLASASVLGVAPDPAPSLSARRAPLAFEREGDAVRLRVEPSGPRHLWVIAVGPDGAATPLVPAGGARGRVVAAPGPLSLADPPPRPVRLVAVLAKQPLPLVELRGAALASPSGRLAVPGAQASLELAAP